MRLGNKQQLRAGVLGWTLLLAISSLLWTTTASSAPTEFNVLTYNVKGLPPLPPFIPENPNIAVIAPRLDASKYDVVAVQEAFYDVYYNDLATNNTGPFPHIPAQETPPFDRGQTGSGLMRLSNFGYGGSYARTTWTECYGSGLENGSDCEASKGYSFARHEIGGGTVDIYNLHADAGQDPGSQFARRDNIDQLIAAIDANSDGNAVIVLGDTNSRYTRDTDNIHQMLSTAVGMPGLMDAWVESELGGTAPGFGSSLDDCDPDPAGAGCELVDKIFFRSGDLVDLVLAGYEVPDFDFQDDQDNDLSDHKPVQAFFDVTVIPEPGTALLTAVGLTVLAIRRRSR